MIDIPRRPNTLWDRQLLGNHLQNINKLIHIPKNVILLTAKILGLYTIMTKSHTLRETLGKKEFQNIYLQQFDKTEFALKNKSFALHKMCPYSELFRSAFSHTQTECAFSFSSQQYDIFRDMNKLVNILKMIF